MCEENLYLLTPFSDQVVIFYIGNIPSKYYKVFGDRDMAGFQEETIMAALLITAEALVGWIKVWSEINK